MNKEENSDNNDAKSKYNNTESEQALRELDS